MRWSQALLMVLENSMHANWLSQYVVLMARDEAKTNAVAAEIRGEFKV